MKIAIATRHFATIARHAGQTREWLLYDCLPTQAPPAPERIELAREQVIHHFSGEGPHPLDGAELIIAASAGDGFVRHMAKRGARVLLTAESDPLHAVTKVLAGEELAAPRVDVTRVLCALHDVFSRH
ncbi:hypothetical protein HCX48_09895 [Rhodocyclus tenuis]|uniref:Nitrogen fixation protein n=1 Tax=Rhodocyclus gracilis TaxID=2929842 RepID=A0ABX0WII1_9RHOO|nr:hypothetical protein [Rhodocyclus gracilis]NJA89533.1 hypothetical protein [Rhodocyclus gracilis]